MKDNKNDDEKKRKKEEKKKRKENKKKGREKGKDLNLEESKEEQSGWDVQTKSSKNRKGRKSVTFADSYPFDPAFQSDCVADALQLIFRGLENHVADKPLYPKAVASAVSRTVAQMVQMVCYSQLYWMEDWNVNQSCKEDWDVEAELELPPIDTWARAVIPMRSFATIMKPKPIRSIAGQFKKFHKPEVQQSQMPQNSPVRRRASETNIWAHKEMKKCDHCTTFHKLEGKRRKTNTLDDIVRRKKGSFGRGRRRLSSMFRDQAMLNKVLKAKGLLPPPKLTQFEEHPRPKPPYFEAY